MNNKILKEAAMMFSLCLAAVAVITGLLVLAVSGSMTTFVVVALAVIFVLCYITAWMGNKS